MNISQNILLTGAGFTQNFGGFLADGMWSEIFNHPEIQTRQTIKSMLLDDFDYESIYNTILLGSDATYSHLDKMAIKYAVLDAYKTLDQLILNYFRKPDIDYIYATRKLIERFSGDMRTIGFFFTLNQDIFIERFYQSSTKPLVIPNMPRIPNPGSSIKSESILEDSDYITVPSKVKSTPADLLSNHELHYIKLHGSFNWRSSDGLNMMVIGKNKEEQINREPLLAWYTDIFKQVLFQKDKRMLVIGYGFQDKHINEIISKGIKDFGLKLYVISPERPKDFVDKLFIDEVNGHPSGKEILKGLSGYFPYKLLEALDGDQFRWLNKYYFLEK